METQKYIAGVDGTRRDEVENRYIYLRPNPLAAAAVRLDTVFPPVSRRTPHAAPVILQRNILRAHAGPFLFSNAIIVFLFLLQFLMKQAGNIVGKGLPAGVIFELIALNLAWILVLSVPMSVLTSTLMAFGRLAADNEATIMRASGMSLYRMIAPVVLASAFVTAALMWFNNRVLPEANIRLQVLMTDIVRIKPTLSIQAGVFTSDEDLPNYRILVRRTYAKSNDLEGVTIYDLTNPEKSVTVTAEHGTVHFSGDYSMIIMDLHDGEIHDMDARTFRSYRRLRFTRHRVSLPASGFGFTRSDAANARRDDRTMSSAMMRVIVDSLAVLQSERAQALRDRVVHHLASLRTSTPNYLTPAPGVDAAAGGSKALLFPGRRDLPHVRAVREEQVAAGDPSPSFSRQDSLSALFRTLVAVRQLRSSALADLGSVRFDAKERDRYLVEIYKKYSIPVACLVFVLIGAPLGMMARRGGFGVGAGLSLGFFLFYWICLIGGEKLADRTVLSPFWGMWLANLVLGFAGIWLTLRSARESSAIDWNVFARLIPPRLRRTQSTDQREGVV
jgi:lipopolysaccharide export system permease protein